MSRNLAIERAPVRRRRRRVGLWIVLAALILIVGASAPDALAVVGVDFVMFALLPLAIVVPVALAAMGSRRRLPAGRVDEVAGYPDDLRDAELRHAFERMLEYRQGMVDTAMEAGDGQLRSMLEGVIVAGDESLRRLLVLARAVEDRRQNRLLGADLARLRSKGEALSVVEREQLASLERADRVARVARKMIGDAQAIMGRCYAQSREIALISGLSEGEPQYLMAQLGEQAKLLDQLTGAVHEVYDREAA